MHMTVYVGVKYTCANGCIIYINTVILSRLPAISLIFNACILICFHTQFKIIVKLYFYKTENVKCFDIFLFDNFGILIFNFSTV